MIESVINALKWLPKEWVTVIMAALPISELRGSIPVALMMGLSPLKAYVLSILGNSLPIIPALVFLEPLSNSLRRFKLWANFFDWLFERTKRKADLIQKYEAIGLMLFVAVPLPMTGAWTGCVAASLFKIRFRYAFAAIFLGVLLAGAVVMAACIFGWNAFCLFQVK